MTETGKVGKPEVLGCAHYKRKCAFVSPCCGRVYTCRLCHNDGESHEINRSLVREVQCLKCRARQLKSASCRKCGVKFGLYFCSTCSLYDDEDKNQFHCDPCGICRVGGKDNFFHCSKCDICLSISLKDSHKCVENVSRANCPVCLEDLHTSREPSHIPPCGHLLHKGCFDGMLKSGSFACPLCGESMLEMQKAWDLIDKEVENTAMPDEYKNFYVQILCKDCHQESRVVFHVVGLKCQQCGSYNTCRTAEPEAAATNFPTDSGNKQNR